MSDPTPSDDELISSYIDGEATLDEVARIQADPELLARVQEFEDATELLSTPVPPLPQADVDRLIDNALAQSATSDRITDLSAIRASRIFNPQRLGTIAAAFLLLAGVVGALVALNSGSDDETASTSADSSDMADDNFGDDGDDMAESDMAEPDMAFDSDMAGEDMDDMGDDMAEEGDYEDDMAEDDGDDMAEPGDSLQATTTVAAVDPRRLDSQLNIEISESYESLQQLVTHTADQWRELIATDFTGPAIPADEEGYEPTEQALAAIPCGQSLLNFMHAMPEIDGVDTLTISETTISGIPITIAVLKLSGDLPPDTAALLAASEPTCTVEQLATLTP